MKKVAKAVFRQGRDKDSRLLWRAEIHDSGDVIIYDKHGTYLSKEKYRNAIHAVDTLKKEGWFISFVEPSPFE